MSRGKLTLLVFVPALAVLSCLRSALGLLPSQSKLGIHLIGSNTAGAVQIENAGPRVIKILDTTGPMLAAAQNYKAHTPDGIVVLRVYTNKTYAAGVDPTASATDFFNTVLAPPLNGLSAANRALIDFVEGPNECDTSHCWGTLADAQWFNTFWVRLAPLIAGAGFRPCAFSIPVGNPPGTTSQMNAKIDAIVPALRVCQQYNGAWSYHPYTLDSYSTSVSLQLSYSLRYRQFYSRFAQTAPDLSTLPMILTEGGRDSSGDPNTSGWQANGTPEEFEAWLIWWDGQLRQDSYILGSTLFEIGDAGSWPSFDLEPIAGWLADYLRSQAPVILSCSPTTLSANGEYGTNIAPVTFTVTNTGLSSMSYSVGVDAAWMSVNPTSGTNTGETDTIAVSFATGMAPGAYLGHVIVDAPGAAYSPQTITVNLAVRIPADFDNDGNIDAGEVATFISCVTEPNAGPPAPNCVRADLDKDNDVDQSDFGLLQRCLTGDQLPIDPDCMQG